MSIGWDDEFNILPDSSFDEDGRAWGDPSGAEDEWLIEERPPHWE